jgi:hypothetical protein
MGVSHFARHFSCTSFSDVEMAVWCSAGVSLDRVFGQKRLHELVIASLCEHAWQMSFVDDCLVGVSSEAVVDLGRDPLVFAVKRPRLLNGVWSELTLTKSLGHVVLIHLQLQTFRSLHFAQELPQERWASSGVQEALIEHIVVSPQAWQVFLQEGFPPVAMPAVVGADDFSGNRFHSVLIQVEVAIGLSFGVSFKRVPLNERPHQSIVRALSKLIWDDSLVEGAQMVVGHEGISDLCNRWQVNGSGCPGALCRVRSEFQLRLLLNGRRVGHSAKLDSRKQS